MSSELLLKYRTYLKAVLFQQISSSSKPYLRIQKVPALSLAYAAVASYFILIPTDATVSGYTGITRLTYELTQFIPLAVIFLLATIFYVWGHVEKRNRDVVMELHLDDPLSDTPAIAD